MSIMAKNMGFGRVEDMLIMQQQQMMAMMAMASASTAGGGRGGFGVPAPYTRYVCVYMLDISSITFMYVKCVVKCVIDVLFSLYTCCMRIV